MLAVGRCLRSFARSRVVLRVFVITKAQTRKPRPQDRSGPARTVGRGCPCPVFFESPLSLCALSPSPSGLPAPQRFAWARRWVRPPLRGAAPAATGEPAWHRRARRERGEARVILALAKASGKLANHHGSNMPGTDNHFLEAETFSTTERRKQWHVEVQELRRGRWNRLSELRIPHRLQNVRPNQAQVRPRNGRKSATS